MGKRDRAVEFAKLSPDGSTEEERAFNTLLRKAETVLQVQQQVHKCLPNSLSPHVRVSALDGGLLTLLVESPVWKTKLRLTERDLIECCRAAGFEVESVKVRIEVLPRPQPEAPSRLVITPAAQAAFDAAAALEKPSGE